jgi:hypothetical protein
VICEVIQLEHKDLPGVRSIDPYAYVRNAIDEKIDQGAAAKALGLPYVIVIGREGLGPGPLEPTNVLGAMHGAIGISIEISTATGGTTGRPPEQVLGQGGRLQKINTRVSGIALVREYNPNRDFFEEAYRRARPDNADAAEAYRIAVDVEAQLVESGSFDPDARQYRLITMHSAFAAVPLDLSVFAGSKDEQYGPLDDSYQLLAQGLAIRAKERG